ncbi:MULTISPECIES: SDR family oxidoreductase [Sphingobium]|uniref:3-ketoacyl-ACP reductase n=1 Tax=Sphingobium cupriresistens LL01 TaxID=1420583 RepID=A0A0J7XNR3_9SPHN|nr:MULTISPECIES: SDR family oxidoreductase [Sphingobium]KMS53274.1 3-ketoacyl-ACP reductase [Sphingobium cupriresistens LL01]MBJ7375245.1 SDR family oxidoreductase [Sphingobium sp.]
MGKPIIVTGAAGILGAAVAAHLATQGLDVVGIDLADSAPDFPGTFVGGVDLTDTQATLAAFAHPALASGIAGLASIAGGFRWETVMDGSPDSWDFLYRINVRTALNAARAAVPLMPTGGAIVHVGAAATAKAAMGMGAYTASKSGVARLTEALAEEHKGQGIRVNAVLPSIVDTPANRAEMGAADAAKWVTPLELAQVVAFLLSDAATAITGASLPVTGRV